MKTKKAAQTPATQPTKPATQSRTGRKARRRKLTIALSGDGYQRAREEAAFRGIPVEDYVAECAEEKLGPLVIKGITMDGSALDRLADSIANDGARILRETALAKALDLTRADLHSICITAGVDAIEECLQKEGRIVLPLTLVVTRGGPEAVELLTTFEMVNRVSSASREMDQLMPDFCRTAIVNAANQVLGAAPLPVDAVVTVDGRRMLQQCPEGMLPLFLPAGVVQKLREAEDRAGLEDGDLAAAVLTPLAEKPGEAEDLIAAHWETAPKVTGLKKGGAR